jgi:hypothetical protein
MPAAARARFMAYAAEQAAKATPWPEETRNFVRACFGKLVPQ